MIQLIQLSFAYHDSFPIFHRLDLRLSSQRSGLVGPNACGKSTLLALIAGRLTPESGSIRVDRPVFFLAQFNEASGNKAASGGMQQRERLAEAFAHEDHLLLLDEPSNHLDRSGRLWLLRALQKHRGGCLIASHDRELLGIMDQIIELQPNGPKFFGGGYDFFKAARDQEQLAFHAAFAQQKQALGKVRKEAQRARERQEKKSAEGHRKKDSRGISRAGLGLMRMQAEQTAGKLKNAHEGKIATLEDELREKSAKLIAKTELHFDVKAEKRAGARPLLSLEGVQHRFQGRELWTKPLHLQLGAGEHVCLRGDNGTGKTTLLRLIMGHAEPSEGVIHRRFREAFLLDQDLSSLPLQKSLLEIWNEPLYQSDQGLRRTIAARLGLKAREAAVPLAELSGGQRLRAALVLLATRAVPVDLILLDEPSNHLDLDAVECLVATLRALPASLIVVSHDPLFLQDLGIEHGLELVRATGI